MKIFPNNNKSNESGLVSIVIASILMIIMALITLGFSRVVQNEQRQSIDTQLSTQAFYAAESGINFVASQAGFPGATAKTDCDVSGYNNGVIDAGEQGVQFTCVLIEPTPEDLVFGNDSVTTNKPRVVPFNLNGNPSSINFQWTDNDSNNVRNNCGGVNNLIFDTNSANWDKIGILRLDLIGVPSGNFGRQALLDNQFNAILYPCNAATGSSSVAFAAYQGSANVGKILPVNCAVQNNDPNSADDDYECRIEITGLPAGISRYVAHFNSIYNDLNVRITADDSSNSPLRFADSQAVVDSTGRANDVFRRVQARVPLYESFLQPNAALQTLDDICKLYQVGTSSVTDNCN